MSTLRPHRLFASTRTRIAAFVVLALWLVGPAWIASPASAAESALRFYNLPAGDAARALRLFVRQSGEEIIFATDTIRGATTRAVRGRFTARQVLEQMLTGSDLAVTMDERTGAFAIIRAPQGRDEKLLPPDRSLDASDAGEIVRLNPFEVRADADFGYGALASNAITTFRADLSKLPVTADIFTNALMDDLAATSIESLLVNYAGTAGFVGSAINVAPGDRDGAGGLNLRAMAISGLKRDGFVGLRPSIRSATGYTDRYATERIELLKGPQSLLYGASGGGGVVNLVSKQARFGSRTGLLRLTLDDLGSRRGLFDYNIGSERVALRFVAVGHEAKNYRHRLDARTTGLYLQLAYRPWSSTTVRLWGERNATDARVAFKPNLDPWLALDDPRRGQDARYLVLTDQVRDLNVVSGGLSYRNLESLAGWWSNERIANEFAGITLETSLNRWLSLQVTGTYGESTDARATQARTLLPAGAVGNPFAETALQVSPADNQQPFRIRAGRATLVAEGEFFGGRARSQTAFGIEGIHTTTVDSIDYAYYRADEHWNTIVDPNQPADYGRTRLEPQVFAVGSRVPRRPLFRPGSERVTIDGLNYVRLPRIVADPGIATPSNPLGLVPNNPGVGNGFSGNFAHADAHTRAVFAANLTEWFDGRYTTLLGARFSQGNSLNAGSNRISYRPPWDEALTGNAGVSVRLTSALQAYAGFSTSFSETGALTRNVVGETLDSIEARSPVPELGVKLHTPDERLAITFAYNVRTVQRNEATSVDQSFLDAINPAGINGRDGVPDRWVNLDRSSTGAELTVTAALSPRWRVRLAAGHTDGRIVSTVQFPQRYNDQFHTDGAGGVTFADGAPLLVDPAGGGGPATTQLTVAMLNDPANPYAALPDPNSGRITGAGAITALTQVDPVHGSAATGATGLPLAAMQYAWDDPYGHDGVVTVFRAGEKSTGYNEYNLNLQCHYTFAQGWLKDVGLFFDARSYLRNRAYYFQESSPASGGSINAERTLYRLPTATVLGLGISYRRQVAEGVRWTTQININNVLDHYRVWIVPHPVGGAFTQARLSTQPRTILWSSSIEF